MDLLSAFKRKTPPATAPVEAADGVQRARTRARQRLIGAAVLVVVGIIGFPLLFETQPRPIPVDLPIEIPRKEGMPPLAMPAPAPEPKAATRPPASLENVITETEADAGREVAASAVPGASAPPTPRAVVAPAPRAAAASADAARAQALLEGKAVPAAASEPAAGAPRFVVQVGAFAEPGALRDVRAKVEKLGLKTYTQVAQTADGPRTRVRVGPFATRGDAERAAAKIKSAELPAVILTL
jgi:DedD protein